jgi:hypothetical protein
VFFAFDCEGCDSSSLSRERAATILRGPEGELLLLFSVGGERGDCEIKIIIRKIEGRAKPRLASKKGRQAG